MTIERKRYAIMRHNKTAILVGCGRSFFCPVDEVGIHQIRTYPTREKAELCARCWAGDVEIVEVFETIEVIA